MNYPKIYNNDIKVLGRVVSIASENKVAAAEQVFDEKFKYSSLGTYSYDNDNIDPTKIGMDQYSINRLLGKKMKTLEDSGLMPDAEGWIHNIKINGLTVKGNATFDDIIVNNNLSVGNKITTKDLEVTNQAIIKKLILNNINVEDFINRINKIIDGTDKDNALWRYILSLEGRIAILEACCEDIHNNPQGGVSITVSPNPINLEVGESVTLTATSNPALAGDFTVSSNDSSIASVSGKTVTGVSANSTSVVVNWGGVTKTVVVNVIQQIRRVTFDPNMEGLQPSTVTVNKGAAVSRPVDPQKEGYTFDGWVLEGETSLYDFSRRVEDDITLKGTWTGNVTPEPTVYSLAIQNKPFSIKKGNNQAVGAKLSGWNEGDATVNVAFTIDNTSIANYLEDPVAIKDTSTISIRGNEVGTCTLTASTVINGTTYSDTATITVTSDEQPEQPTEYVTVTFESNGGSAVQSQRIVKGTSPDTPATPTRANYRFLEWVVGTVEGPTFQFGTPVNEDITLVARWEEILPEYVTVTFDPDGGSEVASLTFLKGGSATKPTDPTKSGYTFVGWFVENSDVQWQFNNVVNNSFTLKAHWSEVPVYTINWTCTYNGGDATGHCNINDQVSGSQSVIEGGSWTGTVLTTYAAGTTITDNGVQLSGAGNIQLDNIHENHNIVMTTVDDRLSITIQGAHAEVCDYDISGGIWLDTGTARYFSKEGSNAGNVIRVGSNPYVNIRPATGYEITGVTFSYDGATADSAELLNTLEETNSNFGQAHITNIKSNATITITTKAKSDTPSGNEGPDSISVADATMKIDDPDLELVVTPTPSTASYTLSSCTSDNPSVCEVYISGNKLYARAVSWSDVAVLVTVTTDNGKTTTCHVTVTASSLDEPTYQITGVGEHATFSGNVVGHSLGNGWHMSGTGTIVPDDGWYIQSVTATCNGNNVGVQYRNNVFDTEEITGDVIITWVAAEVPNEQIRIQFAGDGYQVYNEQSDVWLTPGNWSIPAEQGSNLRIPIRIYNTTDPSTQLTTEYEFTGVATGLWNGRDPEALYVESAVSQSPSDPGAYIVITNVQSAGTVTAVTTNVSGAGQEGSFDITYWSNDSHSYSCANVNITDASSYKIGTIESGSTISTTIPGSRYNNPYVTYIWADPGYIIGESGITIDDQFNPGVVSSVEAAGMKDVTINGETMSVPYYKLTIQMPSDNTVSNVITVWVNTTSKS